MNPQRLFPLRISGIEPADHLVGKDKFAIGEGDDGLPYLLKSPAPDPHLPAAEWICSALAHRAGLAVPPFHLAQLDDGSTAFASRWEGGLVDEAKRSSLLAGRGGRYGQEIARLFALDLFVHNSDRNAGNYLFRQPHRDGAKPAMLVIDFSRAHIRNGWPLPPLPMVKSEITVRMYRYLHQYHSCSQDVAVNALERVVSCGDGWFEEACWEACSHWLPQANLSALNAWWKTERKDRARLISNLIAHEHYLSI